MPASERLKSYLDLDPWYTAPDKTYASYYIYEKHMLRKPSLCNTWNKSMQCDTVLLDLIGLNGEMDQQLTGKP